MQTPMIEIRKAEDADRPAVWKIIEDVIAGGDTYVFEPGYARKGNA